MDVETVRVLWETGEMSDLRPSRPGRAVAIRRPSGRIIGWRGSHALVWQTGRMTALGTLGGKDSEAVAISQHGQIVGWSRTRVQKHAVLWTLRRGR